MASFNVSILFETPPKIFIEPYELSLLVIERENPYWLLVPHNDELIDRIIVTYNHTFGDEEPMQLIE